MTVKLKGQYPHFKVAITWLRPCPFCGEKKDIVLENTHTAHYWVRCNKCMAEVPTSVVHFNNSDPAGTDEDDHAVAARSAVTQWNRRAEH